jgi:hypothetical protein
MAVLTTTAVIGQATVTQTPEPFPVVVSIIVQALAVTALAGWVDRSRIGSA